MEPNLTDSEAIEWITTNGASLIYGQQPDMGGQNWSVFHPLIRSSGQHAKGRTPKEAIDLAMRLVKRINLEAAQSEHYDR